MNEAFPLVESLPWATFGRTESFAEVVSKLDEQRDRLPYIDKPFFLELLAYADSQTTAEDLQRFSHSLALCPLKSWRVTLVYPRALSSWMPAFVENPKYHCVELADPTQWVEVLLKKTKRTGDSPTSVWFGVLSVRDTIHPAAPFYFALASQNVPHASVLYCNEIINPGTVDSAVHFFSKEEVSEISLMHFNTVGRLSLIKASVLCDYFELHPTVEKSSGFETRLWNWGLSAGWVFEHVPIFGFYRSCLDGYLEATPSVSSPSFLARTIEKEGKKITKKTPTVLPKKISTVVCFRDRLDWTERSLRQLLALKRTIPLEIFLVNNQSEVSGPEGKIEDFQERTRKLGLSAGAEIFWVDFNEPFNFAAMHNHVVFNLAKGDIVLFLNNDVFLSSEIDLDEWAAWASHPEVATVGITLRNPDGSIQHAGFCVDQEFSARFFRWNHVRTAEPWHHQTREVIGNTFAACMVDKEVYLSLGGLRPADLPNGFGDVAFTIKAHHQGLSCVLLGHFEGVHLESATRGVRYEYWEECLVESEASSFVSRFFRRSLAWDRVPAKQLAFWPQLKGLVFGWLRVRVPGAGAFRRVWVERGLVRAFFDLLGSTVRMNQRLVRQMKVNQ